MNNQREEILKVTGLKQYFKSGSGKNKLVVKAVDDISFSIYKGEVFSLVGESGCGKTTTGRTIIKLYQSTAGEVYFHGTRIISDVKAAKIEYKAVLEDIKDKRFQMLQELKEMVSTNSISKEEYQQRVNEFDEKFNPIKEQALTKYRLTKRDRNFERVVDQEGIKAGKNIEKVPDYQDIIKYYAQANEENKKLAIDLENQLLNAQKKLTEAKQLKDHEQIIYAKDKCNTLKSELSKVRKELKLNDVRQKQDVLKLAYSLKHKNRLLMRKMQMIFQDPIASLNPRMTVKEIIAEGLRINGVRNEKEIDDRVKEALKIVGLVPEHASRYPHEFSGGQRQRIGIARALVVEPTFIIADEPISALDVSIRAQVINLLNDLRENKGITIMFIAHDLSVVKYFSDRLAVMYYGHIVEVGDKEKIFNNPLHPYTLSLMDSIPLPDPEYEKRRGRTIRYNPAKHHDYSKEQPSLREIEPGHMVLCNTEEFERYQQSLKKK
jgi:ABC-type oligopeptide transport system ATPase subunit